MRNQAKILGILSASATLFMAWLAYKNAKQTGLIK